ncbi:hypothetical protein MJO28_009911 [Puccinia striiformis f. sp. tritici]|uniref:Uncharacterized protein n=2 Tax=Puccinia striiformis f. sp. tritici TaxID=168172 RepID=A0A0L0VNX4_9BASI|nr:hypothetical protein Pst134EA_017254 [Puccinia striiformis f. sp. tritici]KAI9622504.1 hypothetical protein H4Q26_015185 [Puccinia striiformis f. sp. tritici PST-130]KNF00735.1 hypothetical protein PSTG_06149 [Puccinia striiformis f. sp. tritici PST-78]KAH9460945.1 hypothetical protein Pst134EA_017254 [Puccinia striiformis f. sp. tritici]KAI7948003.1 hypothetical protein MJO28_009911 [Puccinia striiformis f. sp. tritici]KAI7951007.1 hypothetical protein MJO29_009681 [Puccinia striiformis f.
MKGIEELTLDQPKNLDRYHTILADVIWSLRAGGATERYAIDFDPNKPPGSELELSVEPLKTLHLPTLKENILRLYDLLFCAPDRADEPFDQFQLALNTLLDTGKTLDEIDTLKSSLSKSRSAAEKDAQDLTAFRNQVTHQKISCMRKEVKDLLATYTELFPVCEIFKRVDRKVSESQEMRLYKATHSTRDGIQKMIDWMDLPDFRVLQHTWQSTIVHELQNAALQTLPESYRKLKRVNTNHALVEQACSDCILVVKLLKIFMSKLSRADNEAVLQMPPDRHLALLRATSTINKDSSSLTIILDRILYGLDYRPNPAAPLARDAAQAMEVLNEYFDLQQGSHPRLDRREFQDWSTHWHKLFVIALERLHDSYEFAHPRSGET